MKPRSWCALRRIKTALVLLTTALVLLALAAPADAAFPGQNGKIAFTRSGPNNPGEVYTMNADGSGVTNITNNPAGDITPAWSPDGRKIAFASDRSGRGFDVYTMNADGTELFRVTSGSDDNAGAAWSPDGTKIVFTSVSRERFGGSSLLIVNADGTGRAVLPTPSGGDPSWSPDGARIAFGAGGFFLPFDIETIDPAGATLTNLTPGGRDTNEHPDWSPDGARLVFVSNRDEYRGEIYTMNPDGTGPTRLTTNTAVDRKPAWSPDGQKIVFESGRDDPNPNCAPCHGQIYVMNADGSGQTRLTAGVESDSSPDWQPLVEPRRSDYRNAAQFCKADREFLGDAAFMQKYGGGANAYGKCVSTNH
jgi:Tol biopolymer transport system component